MLGYWVEEEDGIGGGVEGFGGCVGLSGKGHYFPLLTVLKELLRSTVAQLV